MKNKTMAYLVHLSENMWSDTHFSKMYGFENWENGACFRKNLRCEDEAWDQLVSSLPQFGINTLVVDVGDGICFESHPEIAIEGSWTKEKLDKKLSEAKALGLTVIPKLNFSTCHDIWMKEYSRMISTSIYYKVVDDLITETAELFGNPEFFHIGMDEEDYNNQHTYDYCVVRHGDLWWHDLKLMCESCNKAGARPWVWSDIYWHHP
ncbi:MAG: Tat pathway signal protein, partial [Clostridia bacterium]|nr:Tat pathway signal protein [Clostridia bacterium]